MKSFFWKSLETGFFLIAMITLIPFMAIMVLVTALGALAYAPFHAMNMLRNRQ
jgi:hypothetical protein